MNDQFLDPNDAIAKHGNRLPHWQQGTAFVFVTWRLVDSLPKAKLELWRAERAAFFGLRCETAIFFTV